MPQNPTQEKDLSNRGGRSQTAQQYYDSGVKSGSTAVERYCRLYYRWGVRTREKESLKDAEDKAEVLGPQRYYCCGDMGGTTAAERYCRLAPQRYYRWVRGTTALTQTGQGREERSLQWKGNARRVRS